MSSSSVSSSSCFVLTDICKMNHEYYILEKNKTAELLILLLNDCKFHQNTYNQFKRKEMPVPELCSCIVCQSNLLLSL